MADVVAGGGAGEGPVSVSLTADVSGWEQQLQRAGSAVDRFAKQSEAKFSKAGDAVKNSTEKSGSALGNLGGFLKGGAIGAAATALAVLADQGGKAFKELVLGAANASQKTLALSRAANEATDAVARMNAASSERLASVVDPGERIAEIGRQLADATAQQQKFKEASDASAKKIDELNSMFSGEGWGLWLSGRFDDAVKKHESNLQAMGQNYEAVTGKVKDLAEAKWKALDPRNDSAFMGTVNQMTADLDKQVATWGKAADAVKLYELRLKDTGGKARAVLDKLEEKINKTAEALKQKELNKSFEDLTKQLTAERDNIGKTAEEVKYLDAVAKGFSADQLARIKTLLLETQQKRLDFEKMQGGGNGIQALMAGTKEHANFLIQAQRANAAGKGVAANPAAAGNAGILNALGKLVEQGAKSVQLQQRAADLLREWNHKDEGFMPAADL